MNTKTKTYWPSPEDMRILAQLKTPYTKIGKTLGVSGNAVKKHMKKLGFHVARNEPSTQEICDYCRGSFHCEHNRKERQTIGKYCGTNCQKSAQKQRGKLYGKTQEMFDDMISGGMSIRAVAREWGCNHSVLSRKFNKTK